MNLDDITALHQTYCKMTGKTPNVRVHEAVYADFLDKGFTVDDLRAVLAYVASENRRMQGARFSDRHDKLFDYEYRHFDSLLCEARARERNRPKAKTPQQNVIEAFRKSPEKETDHAPKIVGDVLRKIAGENL